MIYVRTVNKDICVLCLIYTVYEPGQAGATSGAFSNKQKLLFKV